MQDHPNILLVIMDSVRAKNCSLYKHDSATTPFLESFSDEATIYTQAHSPSINSIQSHASIFSGYHPEEHTLSAHNDQLKESENIWKKLITEHSYETGIFSPNAVITEASNLCSVFETYSGPKRTTSSEVFESAITPSDISSASEIKYLYAALTSGRPIRSIFNGLHSKYIFQPGSYDSKTESADVYIDELVDWVSNQTTSWAACVNLMDAHLPYVPKEEHDHWGGERLDALRQHVKTHRSRNNYMDDKQPWGEIQAIEALYDGCIRQIDAELNRLVSYLKGKGEYEDTLLVITSDHGQAFAERSRVTPEVRLRGHAYGIHEVLTHVPLIVKYPHQEEGERINRVSSLTEFPNVVHKTITSSGSTPTFIPDDGFVLVSTDRLKPDQNISMEENDREPYFGPWHAVYREENGELYKYAKRNGDESVLRVRDAQVSYIINKPTDGVVDTIFSKVKNKNVKLSKRELDGEVEQRLEKLGYR